MKIRRVSPDDFAAVWRLHNDALDAVGAGAHGGNGPWDDDVKNPVASYVENGGDFLVAVVSEAIAGMVGLRPHANRTFEVQRMRVAPALQRQGIGSTLLKGSSRLLSS